MILFTLIHLSLVRNEWIQYCRLRHEWLLRRGDDHADNVGRYASLVKVGTSISASALSMRLRRVFPGEIYSVVPVAQSRLSDWCKPLWKGTDEVRVQPSSNSTSSFNCSPARPGSHPAVAALPAGGF